MKNLCGSKLWIYLGKIHRPNNELFLRLLSDFTASLKHLKPVWKYDPFNTWAKEIMASFRTRYDTFILLWLLFSFSEYTHNPFSLQSMALVFPSTIIIDEHCLKAIKTRYLWQTRVHIQPLPAPPTTNGPIQDIFHKYHIMFSSF